MGEVISQFEKDNMAIPLKDQLNEWRDYIISTYPNEKDEMSKQDKTRFQQEANTWRGRVRNELDVTPYIRIELQSGLNPLVLKKVADREPSEFLTEDVLIKLSEIETSDFSDSAKCLLLGTATPAVMVALRGAEASLRKYYQAKTQNDPGKKTWRTLTKELSDNAQTLSIDETFIGFLDYIGAAIRNFAQHPNKIYSLREAVMIFIQVMTVVEDIYSRL